MRGSVVVVGVKPEASLAIMLNIGGILRNRLFMFWRKGVLCGFFGSYFRESVNKKKKERTPMKLFM